MLNKQRHAKMNSRKTLLHRPYNIIMPKPVYLGLGDSFLRLK